MVIDSLNPQLLYSEKKNIKNRSHDTIHTFKNYFITVFSVFSKISCIQSNPKKQHPTNNKNKKNLKSYVIYPCFFSNKLFEVLQNSLRKFINFQPFFIYRLKTRAYF